MSRFTIPRGTARAIRRGNTAPSINFFVLDSSSDEDMPVVHTDWRDEYERESLQRYRDLREEGYSYMQAMLMSGRGDPDSLDCT